MRQLPSLSDVQRERIGWDQLGAKIIHEYQPKPQKNRRAAGPREERKSPAVEIWQEAKELLHNIMATNDPEHAMVRKRLHDLKNPSTAALFSTLSLYLSGKLGISLTITQPLLAVMLFAVHEASGNWDVLRY